MMLMLYCVRDEIRFRDWEEEKLREDILVRSLMQVIVIMSK